MQPENEGVRTWQWVVTVIVIIILIVLGYYLFKGDKVVSPTDDTTSIDDTTLATKDLNRVVVTDQFPGNIVYLSSVQLANPGFVVIHKDNAGKPGEVIGYQYFDKGINPGRVTLTSPTMDGAVYYAMIHSDDGDKVFNAAKDLPLKDASGKEIMRIFRATSSITETKG